MGKRQIGELQPGELVVAILISDLAAVPMGDPGIPLFYGIIPIFTLVIAEMVLSYICLKNEKIRSIVSGRPSVIMLRGIVDEKEMRKLRFNLSDLTEELRQQGYLDISQIDTAILETNGTLTLVPKSRYKAPDCGDMNLKPEQDELPFILISDGKLNEDNLKKSGFDMKWLTSQIKVQGGKTIGDVFIMTYYMGNCYIQLKGVDISN
jgi:uncharacterized membrane protein YcaP (DUF421 family)